MTQKIHPFPSILHDLFNPIGLQDSSSLTTIPMATSWTVSPRAASRLEARSLKTTCYLKVGVFSIVITILILWHQWVLQMTLLHFLPICQSSPPLPDPFPPLTGLDYTIFNHSPTPFFKHKLNSLPFILYLQNPNHGKTLMSSFSALTHALPSTAVENCAHVQIDTSFTPSPSSLAL